MLVDGRVGVEEQVLPSWERSESVILLRALPAGIKHKTNEYPSLRYRPFNIMSIKWIAFSGNQLLPV